MTQVIDRLLSQLMRGKKATKQLSISDFFDESLAFGYQPLSLSDHEYDGSKYRILSDD
jgi:hypothetical protein